MIGTMTLAVMPRASSACSSFRRCARCEPEPDPHRLRRLPPPACARAAAVNFDGVPAGEILSIKLENPRKIVALAMLDNSAPIRKDTVVGIEFQG